jgi:hypothetical protein
LTKNVFGLHFGRFFPSTSGRPGLDRQKEGDWVLPRTVRVTHPRHPSLRPNSWRSQWMPFAWTTAGQTRLFGYRSSVQSCQIFLGPNIPKSGKICQMAKNYTKPP